MKYTSMLLEVEIKKGMSMVLVYWAKGLIVQQVLTLLQVKLQ